MVRNDVLDGKEGVDKHDATFSDLQHTVRYGYGDVGHTNLTNLFVQPYEGDSSKHETYAIQKLASYRHPVGTPITTEETRGDISSRGPTASLLLNECNNPTCNHVCQKVKKL